MDEQRKISPDSNVFFMFLVVDDFCLQSGNQKRRQCSEIIPKTRYRRENKKKRMRKMETLEPGRAIVAG